MEGGMARNQPRRKDSTNRKTIQKEFYDRLQHFLKKRISLLDGVIKQLIMDFFCIFRGICVDYSGGESLQLAKIFHVSVKVVHEY
jgi:hypothetical protein